MDNAEYNSLKKIAKTDTGADDFESLKYYAETQLKNTRYIKWVAWFIIIFSLPLCLILIGFLVLPIGIGIYFFAYRKLNKKAEQFLEHVLNDPELVRA